jgi:ABC-type iron transport system FetAB ATPase subunit
VVVILDEATAQLDSESEAAIQRALKTALADRRHEVHWLTTATLAAMGKYDRPVGVGPLITVDTTVPVDVASVAAEVRRLHASRTG